jgi:hypothetical protein
VKQRDSNFSLCPRKCPAAFFIQPAALKDGFIYYLSGFAVNSVAKKKGKSRSRQLTDKRKFPYFFRLSFPMPHDQLRVLPTNFIQSISFFNG